MTSAYWKAHGDPPIVVGTAATTIYMLGIILAIARVTGIVHDVGSFGAVIGTMALGFMVYIFVNNTTRDNKAERGKEYELREADSENISRLTHIIEKCAITLRKLNQHKETSKERPDMAIQRLLGLIDNISTNYEKYLSLDGQKLVGIIRDTVDEMMFNDQEGKIHMDDAIKNIVQLKQHVMDVDDQELKRNRESTMHGVPNQ